jgi:S1-C subfamily serine protease
VFHLRSKAEIARPVPLALCLVVSLGAVARGQLDSLSNGGALSPNRATPAAAWFAPAAQTPHPSVVRVISPERNGASLGSGTLVDVSEKHGLVLTNWHVVKDAAGNVIVSFPDGFQTPGYVVKMDREWDLAAIVIWKPQAKPVPIAPEVPRQGDALTIAGYGSGNYRAQGGRCVQYLAPAPNRPYDIVEVSAAARHGDSGGPILNSRGELAGVLFGEGGGMTSGSAAARVRWFVESLGIKQSLEPGTQIAAAGAGGKGQGASAGCGCG